MWNAQEFVSVLERHPNGGTLWTHTKRMVRYVRVFRPSDQTVVAVMTEKSVWKGKDDARVELFVRSPAGTEVAEFLNPRKNQEFLKAVSESPVLRKLVEPDLLSAVERFITTPDRTIFYTW